MLWDRFSRSLHMSFNQQQKKNGQRNINDQDNTFGLLVKRFRKPKKSSYLILITANFFFWFQKKWESMVLVGQSYFSAVLIV